MFNSKLTTMKKLEMNLLQHYNIKIAGPFLHYLMLRLQSDIEFFKGENSRKELFDIENMYKTIYKQIKEQSK